MFYSLNSNFQSILIEKIALMLFVQRINCVNWIIIWAIIDVTGVNDLYAKKSLSQDSYGPK